jgi:hypothetical protein
VNPPETRSLARHLVLALAEDFELAEVADLLALAAQLARKAAAALRTPRDMHGSDRKHQIP